LAVLWEQYDLDRYILVTLHRPSNVDEPETLTEIMAALMEISRKIPVLFPVHPRTRSRISTLNLNRSNDRLVLTEPMGISIFWLCKCMRLAADRFRGHPGGNHLLASHA